MNPKTHRRLKRTERETLTRAIIRTSIDLRYDNDPGRPYDFAPHDDVGRAVDVAVEMEEERPGCTR